MRVSPSFADRVASRKKFEKFLTRTLRKSVQSYRVSVLGERTNCSLRASNRLSELEDQCRRNRERILKTVK